MKRLTVAILSVLLSLQTVGAAIVRSKPLDFSHYDATGSFPQVMVSSILQDRDHNIWIASSREKRVVRFDGSHTESFEIDTPEALFLDSDGRVVISSPKQECLLIIDGDENWATATNTPSTR